MPLSKISPTLQKSIIAMEDAKFFEHHGFNLGGIIRALLANIQKRRFSQGGSTITQQLARSLFLTKARTIYRKLAEQVADSLRNPFRRDWRFDEAHREIEVPNLDLTGWYDHCVGTLGHLSGMQQNARTEIARSQTKAIIGPWRHGTFGRKLGEIDFGPQAELDQTDVAIRWFDRWLKGRDNGVERWPAVRYFVMGSARWKSAGAASGEAA